MFHYRIIITALIGAGIIGRMAYIYAGNDYVALGVTLLIAIGFGLGLAEINRFMKQLGGWRLACDAVAKDESSPEEALEQAPKSVFHYLKMRLSGQYSTLPQLSLTPFLVGLMVMLGLLGTFLGLVETLQGARDALTGSTELETVRMGLAAPIQGLSRAFGTSVAGVTASALLGFLLVSVRRETTALQYELDYLLAGPLVSLSLVGRQTLALDSLTRHVENLPTTTQALGQVGENLNEMSVTFQQMQTQSAAETANLLSQTAKDVRETMSQGVGESITQAAQTLDPVLSSALKQAKEQAQHQFEQWNTTLKTDEQNRAQAIANTLESAMQEQLAAFRATMNDVLEEAQANTQNGSQAVTTLLNSTRETMENFSGESRHQFVMLEEQLGNLRAAIAHADVETVSHLEGQIGTITGAITTAFNQLDEGQKERTQQLFGELGRLDAVVQEHLSLLGEGLEAPLTKVIETAAEAPKSVSKMLETLDTRLEERLERENSLLQDRQDLMDAMRLATEAVQKSTEQQGTTLEELVSNCDNQMSGMRERANEELMKAREQLEQSASMIATGGVEMTAVASMFTTAVEDYRKSNDTLMEGLVSIQEALNHSGERSNDQLSMYVDQAREIIDQSIISQKEMFDALREMRPTADKVELPS
ncbi:MAG: hypothetical protein HOI23_20385 [Deltaproteobacteria bacterium]|jgi:hypothetical protein|nr:hypothetical protein [Deltaproteobacteria bacterium]MBT6434857.1 hypothetical protein [Deltaproteobacteria bacterium]